MLTSRHPGRGVKRSLFLLCLLTLFTCIGTPQAGEINEAQFSQGLTLLCSNSFADKQSALQLITASGSPHAEPLLQALLKGELSFTKADRQLITTEKEGKRYAITDALTGRSLGFLKKRKFKKIRINNQLRGELRAALARLNLTSRETQIRHNAVTALIGTTSPELLALLKEQLAGENSARVRKAIQTALAVAALDSPQVQERRDAVKALEGSLIPAVKNALVACKAGEKDKETLALIDKALSATETRIAWYGKLETIFFGLSLGSVLVLAAIGLAITFGVVGVINMAHGELIMLGAYTTYVMQQLMPHAIGTALLLSIPAAFCVSGLAGIIIEKTVIRFLYGRPLETLLATFGISLILQQLVRTIFSPLNRSVATPAWMSGSIALNPVLSLTTNRVTIFLFSMVVFAVLFLLLKKSSLGLHVRAVAQNRAMARAMGVRAARVDALTFGLGSGIAGIAGVALSQLTNVGPNLGQAYIIDSFMVVVFGGVGNLWGTLIGGLTLGISNKFLEPWSGAVLAKILILVFIILFIQKRPQGLFPRKGRAAE